MRSAGKICAGKPLPHGLLGLASTYPSSLHSVFCSSHPAPHERSLWVPAQPAMHHCPQHFVFKTIFRARPGLSPFSFEGKLPHQQVEDSPHTFASNGSNISACVLDATSRNFNSPCSVHGYLPPNHGRELIVLRHYVSALHKHRRQHAHAPADTMMTPRTDDSIAGASLSPSHTRPLLLTRSLSLIPPNARGRGTASTSDLVRPWSHAHRSLAAGTNGNGRWPSTGRCSPAACSPRPPPPASTLSTSNVRPQEARTAT